VVAIGMKTIGEAARFFLTRHRACARVGAYVVTTTEVRPSAFETTVTWGEGGPEVEHFDGELAFDLDDAKSNHEAVCERVEASVGLVRVSAPAPPAA
jgi:hypothetical protein